ncbi:universal stress protein PHOS34-like [Punica granatum]|uniref:Universal stress protein PHOS34-like n=1 Tax=Punica granatum TaxID=22663 RepID=A0A218VSL5_PUNGR|nr:universal stress protein PHOS34-like [Punica granatum]OWM63544.1 hypothetical protein CDL15_Pgr019494 [Punica granatum]
MEVDKKQVVVVGIDDGELGLSALQWTIDHLIVPFLPESPTKLVVVHAKPSPVSVLGGVGPGASVVLSIVESDLRKVAALVIEKAQKICESRSVHQVEFGVVEGDARNVLCEAVEKHQAAMLVVGSHGYGALKRAFLGSVSDYCIHNASCSVVIVKKT